MLRILKIDNLNSFFNLVRKNVRIGWIKAAHGEIHPEVIMYAYICGGVTHTLDIYIQVKKDVHMRNNAQYGVLKDRVFATPEFG